MISPCGHDDDALVIHLRLDGFDVLRCSRCGLVLLDLDKDEQALRARYDADYFKSRHAYFFGPETTCPDGRGGYTDELADGLRRLERLRPGRGRLLDVGCGIGAFVGLARARGWDARGVDISPFAVRWARDRLGDVVDEGTLESVGYPAESFDVVTLWDSIEHVADPLALLREVQRILAPGGSLLLNTPNEAGLLRLIALICYRATGGRFRYPAQKLYHVYHLYSFTPATLSHVLVRAGFEVMTLERTLIPLVKARGTRLEKLIVGLFAWLERATGREYQLLAIARKPG